MTDAAPDMKRIEIRIAAAADAVDAAQGRLTAALLQHRGALAAQRSAISLQTPIKRETRH